MLPKCPDGSERYRLINTQEANWDPILLLDDLQATRVKVEGDHSVFSQEHLLSIRKPPLFYQTSLQLDNAQSF